MYANLQIRVSLILISALLLAVSGCVTHTTSVDNTVGRGSVHEDPGSPGVLEGVGFSSQDVISMCDRMVRDILANPFWQENRDAGGQVIPPRIVVDDRCFRNRGSEKIDKALITDQLRTGLIRAAKGRLTFLARHLIHVVEHERDLKRNRMVGAGTKQAAASPLGADYRLCASLTTQDKASSDGAMISRYTQVATEIVDVSSGKLVWSALYSFRKAMPARLAARTQQTESRHEIKHPPAAPPHVGDSLGNSIVAASGGESQVQRAGRPEDQFNIRVWSDQSKYRIGDQLRLHFWANQECFLFLFYQSSSGEVTLIYPKKFGDPNRVEPEREYTIPDSTYGVDIVFQPPPGTDQVKAMATTDPDEARTWQRWGLGVLQDKVKRHRPAVTIRVMP